jgi:3-dehydroquinate synthase
MKHIYVSTGRPYTVSVGTGLLARCGEILRDCVGVCSAALVTDSNVGPLYAAAVEKSLTDAGFRVNVFTFPAGEGSKNMATLSDLLEFMAGAGMTRTDCVVALGGGVTGDLAGFAAGCFLRGIRFVQMPTTLLAAVDSSVGGKTAVNLKAGKNLAGAFWQPSAVICDTDCLATLPEEDFACGAAEVIKTAVLNGEDFFSLLEEGGLSGRVEDVIARAIAHKARIVESDEREAGIRKTLNLGHTVGHAVEACSRYTVPHGRAVSIGLAVITRAAASLGLCDRRAAGRIIGILEDHGLPVETEFSTEAIVRAALRDKKRSGEKITLIMPQKIGACSLWDVPIEELSEIVRAGRKESS